MEERIIHNKLDQRTSESKKRIFICGSFHGNNLGDLAILHTYITNLEKSGEYDFRILSKDGENVKELLDWKTKHNIEFVSAINFFKICKSIKWANRVVIGGGGLFFDYGFFDTIRLTGKSQLLPWILITILSKISQTDVYWVGVGMGPFSRLGSALVKFGAKFADRIEVRDKSSHEFLVQELYINKSQKSADIVYLRKEPKEVIVSHKKKSSLTNLLVTLKGSEKNYEQYAHLLKNISREFPDLKMTIFSTNPKTDNEINIKLSEELKINFIDTSNMKLLEFYNLFDNFDLLLSMRLHALLIAYQQGIIGIGIASEVDKNSEVKVVNKVVEFQSAMYDENLAVESLDFKEVKPMIEKVIHNKKDLVEISNKHYEKLYKLAGNNLK